ncbi:MAG: D-lactate dehydrogenase, partial [Cellvibrionaceae bacterium]
MSTTEFLRELSNIVGSKNIYSNKSDTEFYRKGFRSGQGEALAVVFPTSLLQQWKILQACVDNNKIIIMQAANTGLTEGSTPSGDDYDRDIVIINITRIKKIMPINNAQQVISFPGSTLFSLEKLLKPLNRSPHSVIGSSCLGASIVGGIANNSGGALVKRGPAYTELSLHARVTKEGKLELVNHLGINGLGETPEEILTNIEEGKFSEADIVQDDRLASDREYVDRVRDVDADTAARFNADKRRLFEASGCAGKVAIFAVRLDTFPVAKKEKVFYIGTNNPAQLTKIRRDILSTFTSVPDIGEYMHRDIFNLAEKYGKDTFLLINYLGTDPLPKMFAIKGRVESYLNKIPFLPKYLPDRILQWMSQIWPQALPKRMLEYRDKYEHHLIIKMTDDGIAEAEKYLSNLYNTDAKEEGAYFECTEDEAKKAFLQRFAAAGAPVRYEVMKNKAVLALDIALRRNDEDWVEVLPKEVDDQIELKLYYGHFFCHVFHQDYILKEGADPKKVKKAMLKRLDTIGAKYPAEHNVGHLYEAEQDLKAFYNELDPTNTFNPGIGYTDKKRSCN